MEKVHFVEGGENWANTICGLGDYHIRQFNASSNKWEKVTCKKCLRSKKKYELDLETIKQ